MYQQGDSGVIPYHWNRYYNELKAFGEGTVSVRTDAADVTIGVITENKNLEAAQSENSKITKQVIDGIKDSGVASKDIQTQGYNISPKYDYSDGKQVFRGYEVANITRVHVRDINAIGKIIDTAVKNGANNIGNITLSVSNPEKYYNEALSLAIEDAQSKAITVANKLKVSLNLIPIKIIEQEKSNVVNLKVMTYKVSGDSTTIEAGENKIIANIEVIFVYAQ